jgi:hypothetical protein
VTDERGTSECDLLTPRGQTSNLVDLLTDNAEVTGSSPRSTATVTPVEAMALRPE